MDFLEGYPQVIPNVYNIDNEVYHHELPGLSSSNVRKIYHSIAQYEWDKKYPSKQTDAQVEGSATHDRVLLPDTFNDNWFVSKYKTKSSDGFKKDAAENPEKTVLTQNQGFSIDRQVKALYDNPSIKKVLTGKTMLREVSMWAHDPTTDLLLKVRPDIIFEGVCYDLKTTSGSVAPRPFLQSIYKWKYHVQAAYYRWVCGLAGIPVDDFVFLCVERKPPYHTAIYRVNDDLISEGRGIIRESLNKYSLYKSGKDKWTGLTNGREVVTL